MYIGSDGKVYQNKFESLGHGTSLPGYAKEQREINDYLGELRQRQQEYAGKEQQQAQTQQQIDRTGTDNFYNRQRQLAEVQGQPYGGYGQGNPNVGGQAGQQQRSGQAGGFGMPMERTKTVQDPLVQDAGTLHRMLNEQYRQQRGMADPSSANPQDLINAQANRRGATDGGSMEDITGFINRHPSISHNNVSGIRFNDSDRNDDPLVSLLGESGDPVKQFYLSSLSNLNNFAGQKKQTYDVGNKGASDPGKLMEQLREQAEMQAQQTLTSNPNLNDKDRQKLLPREVQNQLNQLMKPYQPRNPGYQDGPVQYQNDNPNFDLFGLRGGQGGGSSYQDVIDEKLGNNNQQEAAPPPPSATAQPKRGQGYGFGGNSMLPGDWRKYLHQNNPNFR